MIDSDVNYFLDTLYYNDHTVLYNGAEYFFNAVCTDRAGISYFEIYKTNPKDNSFEVIYKIADKDIEKCATDFIDKPLFDGKTFWEAECDMTEIDW